jgi:ubiquinone/menaquinone biosynthesis C-methylase UbiE
MPLNYRIEEWLTDAQTLEYSDYWNDEAEERKKPFWILDGDFEKMERYLDSIGLVQQLDASVMAARQYFGRKLRGVGCDLAAGSLWAEPHLLRLGAVEKIYCVDYSRHRLSKLGPAVLEHYHIPPHKIVLALGDFHYLRLPDAVLDFVFMSAAFHHSDEPARLLREIKRVLKPEGLVIIIGEHIADLSLKHYVRQPIKFMISTYLPHPLQRRWLGRTIATRHFLPKPEELFAADGELGDHHYPLERYKTLFSEAGFRHIRLCDQRARLQSFVLAPVESR